MNITDAMKDPKLFARWFAGESWDNWLAFLSGLFALPMTEARKAAFRRFTGRSTLPQNPFREAWVIAGRRGGKSLVAAITAVFLACFVAYAQYLAPGEVPTVMVIAATRRQARVIMGYVVGLLKSVPMLSAMIAKQTQDAVYLTNGVVIEIHTCDFRAIRGYTIAACICDEIAYWRTDDSANPDFEILKAIRPGMATIPGSLLLCISSPYARRGVLWEAHRDHYGRDGDPVLVWQADSKSMNPTIDPAVIEAAYAQDEAAASAEYGAQFRKDIESFVSREAVEACVIPSRHSLPHIDEFDYFAFVDPSGGAGDSMALAIAHRDGDRGVLDLIVERKPPFSPEAVTVEFAKILKIYRAKTKGDRYGGMWPRESFGGVGIKYEPSDKSKSEIYQCFLPLLTSQKIELLDNPRLIAQLCGLERRSRGGRDIIDHAPNANDDVANAAAGALVAAAERKAAAFMFGVRPGYPGAITEDQIFNDSLAMKGR